MQREIRTAIDIDATAEVIWGLLVDLPAYPAWNELLPAARGRVAVGEKVRFSFRMRPLPPLRFAATVLQADPGAALRWAGSMPFAAAFRAEHYFLLEPLDAGATRFRHGEKLSGALAPLVWPLMRRIGPRAYAAMNEALKRRAECGRAAR